MTAAAARSAGLTRGWRRVGEPALVAAAVLGGSLVLHVRDPHQGGSYLFCPWLLLTGTFCPGCGSLRAMNDLTHGEVAAALSSNLMVVASLPVLVLLWGRWAGGRWRGVSRPLPPRVAYAAVAVLVLGSLLFGILRNLEVTSWLAP